MSHITLTIIHYRGETLALGRNLAVKLLLEKAAQETTGGDMKTTSERLGSATDARIESRQGGVWGNA